MPYEELSSLGDTSLRKLLKEVAKAGDKEAMIAVVRAFKNIDHVDLNQEEAHHVMGIGYNLPVEAFLSDGRNTNLTDLLIAAIRKAPNDDGVCNALGYLVKAKVKTNYAGNASFLNAVLGSDLSLSDKMKALDLSDDVSRIGESTLGVLEKQLLRHIDNNYDNEVVLESVRKVVGLSVRCGAGGEALARTISSYRECRYAALVAKAIPESFGTACDEVLKSGCPEALAAFWQAHSARCDRKVFLEKLTEAVRPDPEALAKAILENKGGRRGHYGYPMLHPLMFHPGMMMGPFGRW